MKANLNRQLFIKLCDTIYSDVIIGQRMDIEMGAEMIKEFLESRMALYEEEKKEYLLKNPLGQ